MHHTPRNTFTKLRRSLLMMLGKITSIHRYPVKSMGGEDLDSVEVTRTGLEGDRAYALTEAGSRRLVTAKNSGGEASILDFTALYSTEPGPESVMSLQIRLPDGKLTSPREPDCNQRLSLALKREVHLTTPVRSDTHGQSIVATGAFFDLGTIHIVSTSSMNALQTMLPKSEIHPRRFRANFVIELIEGDLFVEETWIGRLVRIGEVSLVVKEPTVRCTVPTRAQGSLTRDVSILRTIFQEIDGFFGVYADVLRAGPVRVNDVVELT
ncbi:MOSC domain-containing protein [Paraburkholderia caribensis]|uniref:MOSC domain-containing protein n=1 Tax=Paraburkholderia caribensis TaxID=75105 RepID=UPI0034D2B5FF